MKYVSIIICHYGLVDDFGGLRAERWGKVLGEALPRSELIRKCLTSLKENTDYPAEVIVIDNGGIPDDSDYLLSEVRKGTINTYIRNKNNMNFGWAWNQGIKLATSPYILLTCNDIEFKPQWLSKTVEAYFRFKGEKYLATPFITPDKTKGKNPRGEREGFRINSMAGSNCMLMTKKEYNHIGAMTTHHIAGSHWHRRMNEKGYLMIAPHEDYAHEMAWRRGTNLKQKIKVKEDLLNGEVDFSFPYEK